MSKKFSYYAKNKDGIDTEYCWYDSSNVVYTECLDPDNDFKTLKVVFSNGTQYEYKKVNSMDYLLLREDSSQGKALNRIIKGKKYEYEKLGNADLDAINDELFFRSNDGIYIENGSEFFEIRNNKDESLFKLSKPLDKDYFDLVVDILKAVGKNVKEIEHDQ